MSEPVRIYPRNGDPRQVMLTQLGAGGARIATAQRLRPGDVIRLDFKIGVAQRRQMTAIVAYAMKDECGFQWVAGLSFVNLEPKGDPNIAGFIEAEQRRRLTGFAVSRA